MTKMLMVLVLIAAPLAAMGARFEIPDGDITAFNEAIRAASESPGTDVIELAPFGYYPGFVFDPPNVFHRSEFDSSVVVIGNGATLRDVEVTETGAVFLIDATVRGAAIGTTSTVPKDILIINRGSLLLNRVTVLDQLAYSLRGTNFVVYNPGGTLNIRNSTFANNATQYGAGVFSGGTISAENVTIANNYSFPGGILSSFRSEIRNTIVGNNDSENCSPDAVFSLGGNIDTDGTCGLNRPSDQSGVDPLLGPLTNNGGLTLTHLPALDSPAVDAGVGNMRIDQRGLHRLGKRDSGAVEVGGIEGQTIGPWASGTWYVAKENGHYFVVEFLDDSLVLAYWLTYDTEGNQRWIYATGAPEGSRVLLEAYTSQGMRSPEFRRGDREQTPWGVLELHFRDCNHGWAEWHTGESGFVAATAPLRRLTGIEGNPCPEFEAKVAEDLNRTARWSGTWHVPPQDGHYFVVEGISNESALIYWLTYDDDGLPRWIYGVGAPMGDVLAVDAFIAKGMRAPEFDPDDQEQAPWGTLQFEFRSCNFSEATWDTDFPGFNPGSEVLRRVTALEGLGCD